MLFMICAAPWHKEVSFCGGCISLCIALSCCPLALRTSLVPASSQGSPPFSWAPSSHLAGAEAVRGLGAWCGATLPPPVSCLQGTGWGWLQRTCSEFCSVAGGKHTARLGERGLRPRVIFRMERAAARGGSGTNS